MRRIFNFLLLLALIGFFHLPAANARMEMTSNCIENDGPGGGDCDHGGGSSDGDQGTDGYLRTAIGAPVITQIKDYTFSTNSFFSFNVIAVDDEGDLTDLHISVPVPHEEATVVSNGNTIIKTIYIADTTEGIYEYSAFAIDAGGDYAQADAHMYVSESQNDFPVDVQLSASTQKLLIGETKSIAIVSSSYEEGSDITISVTGLPPFAAISENNPGHMTIYFHPTENFHLGDWDLLITATENDHEGDSHSNITKSLLKINVE